MKMLKKKLSKLLRKSSSLLDKVNDVQFNLALHLSGHINGLSEKMFNKSEALRKQVSRKAK